MRKASGIFVIILFLFTGFPINAFSIDAQDSDEVSLCRALEAVNAGDKIPLVVTGILSYQTLYDPEEPTCRMDVQPSTFVSFSEESPIDPDLKKLLSEERRAQVTVKGILLGPPLIDTTCDAEPEAMDLVRRYKGRYGNQKSYRTQFVIQKVLDFSPVDPSVSWNLVVAKPKSMTTIPLIKSAGLPLYPESAKTLHAEGEVTVRVSVEKGVVTNTEILAGHKLLIEGTIENIESWVFERDVNTIFTSTFTYRLEKRLSGNDSNAVIQARLPLAVLVVAPFDAW